MDFTGCRWETECFSQSCSTLSRVIRFAQLCLVWVILKGKFVSALREVAGEWEWGGQSGDEEMLAEVMCGKVCENGEAKWGGGGRYEQRHLLQSYFTPV